MKTKTLFTKASTLLIPAILLSISACKKDRTCSCTQTNSSIDASGTTTVTGEYTYKRTYKKLDKQHANQSCVASSITTYTTPSGTSTVTQITNTECKLE